MLSAVREKLMRWRALSEANLLAQCLTRSVGPRGARLPDCQRACSELNLLMCVLISTGWKWTVKEQQVSRDPAGTQLNSPLSIMCYRCPLRKASFGNRAVICQWAWDGLRLGLLQT